MKECDEWKGTISAKGYGVITIRGKQLYAHRLSLMLRLGRGLPSNKVIDHLCRNTRCINPEHLELVTNGENVLRGESAPAKNRFKTQCPKGHPLDGTTTRTNKGKYLYKEPKIWRYCRTCKRVARSVRNKLKRKLYEKR